MKQLTEKFDTYDLLDTLESMELSPGTCDTIIGIFATTLKEREVEEKLVKYMKYGIIKEKLSDEEIEYLLIVHSGFGK